MKRRIWGLPTILQWPCAEPETAAPAVTAVVQVVHVVHHYPSAGGIGPDPSVIQAILQPRAAIATEEGK